MKNLKIIFFILAIVMLLISIFISVDKHKIKQDKKVVAVTTFALYDIAKHIGSNSVDVINILPFGVDPHSFEPTPKLMIKLQHSNIIIYSGAGLEPWTGNFHFSRKAINMSRYMKLRYLKKSNYNKGELDPHYWLDFENMKKATLVITKELIKLLPDNRDLYIKNEQKYLKMLERLDSDYKNKLLNCDNKTVIVSHNALGYIAKRYSFNVESLTGLSPESDPSAQDINRIFKEIKSKGIHTVFFENFINEKLIKSIANDAKIKFELFEPLGNITADEAKMNVTYEDIMKKNLVRLSEAMQCH